jgi:hypothetical protein
MGRANGDRCLEKENEFFPLCGAIGLVISSQHILGNIDLPLKSTTLPLRAGHTNLRNLVGLSNFKSRAGRDRLAVLKVK